MSRVIHYQEGILVVSFQKLDDPFLEYFVRFDSWDLVFLDFKMISVLEYSSKWSNFGINSQIVVLPGKKQDLDLGIPNTVALRPCCLDCFIQVSSKLSDVPDMTFGEGGVVSSGVVLNLLRC